jgi:hypothetical protein
VHGNTVVGSGLWWDETPQLVCPVLDDHQLHGGPAGGCPRRTIAEQETLAVARDIESAVEPVDGAGRKGVLSS